jgi:hypothetical protein
MAKNKVFKMEYVWAFMTALTFVFFVYATIKQGFSESYIMGIFTIISFLMYLWRKALRRKEEREKTGTKQ